MPKATHTRRNVLRRIANLACAATGLTGAMAGHAQAQESYPSRVIRIVVAFPPGNSSDVVARMLAEQLQRRLGQPVVVENRPGASGILAATAVQRSPADGYTLLMTSTSFVINRSVLKTVPYDVGADFSGINLINSIPAVLLVNPSFPASTLQEFLAEVRKNPGKYSYGHPGTGTIQNMSMKLFQQQTDTDILEVPYKGSVQAIADILGGSLDMIFEAANSAFGQVESGRLKAIVSTGPVRLSSLPRVPTLIEGGVNVSVVGFTVLVAPAGTPTPIVARINGAVQEILKMPEIEASMKRAGLEVFPQMGHADVNAWLANEGRRWQEVASTANIERQ